MCFPIDNLLLRAVGMNASDLHISEKGPVVVRVYGTLTKLAQEYLGDPVVEGLEAGIVE